MLNFKEKHELRRFIQLLYTEYGYCRVSFKKRNIKKDEGGGFYQQHPELIIVCLEKNLDLSEILGVLCHEYGHFIQNKRKLWKNLNKNWYHYRRLGLRMERHCDKLGEQILKKHRPDLSFDKRYSHAHSVKWYKSYQEAQRPVYFKESMLY